MNRFTIAAGAGAVAVVLAGCGPDLAGVPYGQEEARWQRTLMDNYSGYEAPRTAPPAVRNNVSQQLLDEEEARRRSETSDQPGQPGQPVGQPTASDDPAALVDSAAGPAPAEPQLTPPPAADPAPKAAPAPKAKEPIPADGVYVVKPGDTLGAIALKFYGDARRSDVILRANPSLKGNPNFVKDGMKLKIPKI